MGKCKASSSSDEYLKFLHGKFISSSNGNGKGVFIHAFIVIVSDEVYSCKKWMIKWDVYSGN